MAQRQAQPLKVNSRAQWLRSSVPSVAPSVAPTLAEALENAKAKADFKVIQDRAKVLAEAKAAEDLFEVQRQAVETQMLSDPMCQAKLDWESPQKLKCLSPDGKKCPFGCTSERTIHAVRHPVGTQKMCGCCGEIQTFPQCFDQGAHDYYGSVDSYPYSYFVTGDNYNRNIEFNKESREKFLKFVMRGNLCDECWEKTCAGDKTCQFRCDKEVFLETTTRPMWVKITCKNSKCDLFDKEQYACGKGNVVELSCTCAQACYTCYGKI